MQSPNWTRQSIIRILESLLQIGVDLRSKHMEKAWYELFTAAEHQFGSWEETMITLARRPVAPEDLRKLNFPEASLELHFRDDPDGKVYLQASYVDIYDKDNGCSEEIESTVPGDYDF